MNSENFGGSYDGYGFNPDRTEKDRNDLTPEDFSRNENLGHGAFDSYRKEEIAEEVEEQGYEETVREDLDHLLAELDKQPRDARILGYIEFTKEILARLEKEVKVNNTESLAKLGKNQFGSTENAQTETVAKLDEKPGNVSYIDKNGFSWASRENAIQNDDDKYNP